MIERKKKTWEPHHVTTPWFFEKVDSFIENIWRVVDDMLREAAASKHPDDWLVHWGTPYPKRSENKNGDLIISVAVDHVITPPDIDVTCWSALTWVHHACLSDVRESVRKHDEHERINET